MDNDIQEQIDKTYTIYDEWWKHFNFSRDVQHHHHALVFSLIEKGVIDQNIFNKNWCILMENDLKHIRKNLEKKANDKKHKPRFHSTIFGFLKRFIFSCL